MTNNVEQKKVAGRGIFILAIVAGFLVITSNLIRMLSSDFIQLSPVIAGFLLLYPIVIDAFYLFLVSKQRAQLSRRVFYVSFIAIVPTIFSAGGLETWYILVYLFYFKVLIFLIPILVFELGHKRQLLVPLPSGGVVAESTKGPSRLLYGLLAIVFVLEFYSFIHVQLIQPHQSKQQFTQTDTYKIAHELKLTTQMALQSRDPHLCDKLSIYNSSHPGILEDCYTEVAVQSNKVDWCDFSNVSSNRRAVISCVVSVGTKWRDKSACDKAASYLNKQEFSDCVAWLSSLGFYKNGY